MIDSRPGPMISAFTWSVGIRKELDVNVADLKSIQNLFGEIGEEFGRLDGAVNNAAITQDAYDTEA